VHSPALYPPDTAAKALAALPLHVDHLTKRFGGVTAVDDVSFDVAPGEAVAVIGPNGAGKSSLLKLLSGVYKPDEGSVRFGEAAVERLPAHAVAHHGIGLAHQIPRPFKGLTVRENVVVGAMARRGHPGGRGEHIESVLNLCGLEAKAGFPASELRLLDLKRLELARALSSDPSLILLDEVAAGLNGRDLEQVIELVRTIHGHGRSLVIVEHVEGVVASVVNRVLVIDWGKLIAEGTPAEISADPQVREVYLGAGRTQKLRVEAPARVARSGESTPLLRVDAATTSYGDIVALREVSLDVDDGEIVAVLGANGAGKSTLAGTISGLLRPSGGLVLFGGEDVSWRPSFTRNRRGIAHCPEGRRIFGELTVRENLLLTGPLRQPRTQLQSRLEAVHDIFPMLADFASRRAGALSGGQQQMLAIGRALMSEPRLLICDEISLGLAPVAIDALYDALVKIRDRGVAVVLIEQNVHRSLAVADRVYVLERGRVSYSGPPEPLADEEVLNQFYFGAGAEMPLPNQA